MHIIWVKAITWLICMVKWISSYLPDSLPLGNGKVALHLQRGGCSQTCVIWGCLTAPISWVKYHLYLSKSPTPPHHCHHRQVYFAPRPLQYKLWYKLNPLTATWLCMQNGKMCIINILWCEIKSSQYLYIYKIIYIEKFEVNHE